MTPRRALPSRDLLLELFDFRDGVLVRKSNEFVIGSQSEGRDYLTARVRAEKYYVHRIIWKMCTGQEPLVLDHINGNRRDNRFENLRPSDYKRNGRNKSRYSNNATGQSGLTYEPGKGLWRGRIQGPDGRLSKRNKDRAKVESWLKDTRIKYGYSERHAL